MLQITLLNAIPIFDAQAPKAFQIPKATFAINNPKFLKNCKTTLILPHITPVALTVVPFALFKGMNTFDAFETGWVSDAYNAGYQVGQGIDKHPFCSFFHSSFNTFNKIINNSIKIIVI